MESTAEDVLKVEYIERVKHVYSQHRTNDEELEYARSITETAEMIQVSTISEPEPHTEVQVYTPEAVYHFRTFRADYPGHASRTLVELLAHFHVNLPLEYVIAHKTFTVYLNGNKIVAGDKEYPISARAEGYELVEQVEWSVASAKLDIIYRWAQQYQITPEEVVESAVSLLDEKLSANVEITQGAANE